LHRRPRGFLRPPARRLIRATLRHGIGLRAIVVSAGIAVLLGAGAPPAAAAPPRQREAPIAESPPAAPPGDLDIRFDLAVVDRFLQFVEQGAAAREDLEGWSRLPGNRELLRQGRLEGGLNADILQEAARVTLAGGVFSGPPTLG